MSKAYLARKQPNIACLSESASLAFTVGKASAGGCLAAMTAFARLELGKEEIVRIIPAD